MTNKKLAKAVAAFLMTASVTMMLAGCGGGDKKEAEKKVAPAKPEITWSETLEGKKVDMKMKEAPKRAVSMSFATTEMMLAIGLQDQMAGTAFKEEEISTTKQIIKDLEADQIPMINIYNKYDLLGGPANFLPKEDEMFVSLLEKEDVEEALKFIVSNVTKNWERHQIELPYSIDFVSFSKENYVVSKKEKEDGYLCDVFLNPAFKYKYLTFLQ